MTRSVAAVWRTAWCLVAFVVFGALAACGGGDDGGSAIQHPPTISNLRYTPSSVQQSPGGAATISGTFDFSDAGGDIVSLRMTTSAGGDLTVPTAQLNSIRSGTAVGQVVMSTDQAGRYTFEVWVADSAGNPSNKLTGAIEVVAVPPPVSHAPSIATLTYSPSFAYQSTNATARVTASVQFADSGGDLAALHMALGSGEQYVSTPGLAGITSGTAGGTFEVPLDATGRYTFEVWATDSSGAASTRLAGSFDVLTPPAVDHKPMLGNLRLSPKSVYQTTGTTLMSATVDFADAGADIVSFRMTSSAGTEASLPGVPGSGGTTTLTMNVPVDRAGTFTVQVWAVDAKGSASETLGDSYQILSPDTWMKLPFVPSRVLLGIAWNGSRYVAVGVDGIAVTSLDLVNWTTTIAAPGAWGLMSVAGNASGFVAVGSRGEQAVIMRSIDGNAWVEALRGTALGGSSLSSVIWTGTQYVAVGYENPGSGPSYALILTSLDGMTWTQQATRMFEVGDIWGIGLRSVAWSGSLFVAIGQDPTGKPRALRSVDAITWSEAGVLPGATVMEDYDVAWGHGRFVAVGWGNGTHAPTFVSTDGVTWESDPRTVALPDMWAVTAGPDGFMAVGWTHRQSSADGLNWTTFPMTGCSDDVIWDGARYVAVGESICKSP